MGTIIQFKPRPRSDLSETSNFYKYVKDYKLIDVNYEEELNGIKYLAKELPYEDELTKDIENISNHYLELSRYIAKVNNNYRLMNENIPVDEYERDLMMAASKSLYNRCLIHDFKKRLHNIMLAYENKHLSPALEHSVAGRVSPRIYDREQSKKAGSKRPAQKRAVSRTKAKGIAMPDRPKAALKARTSGSPE